MRNWSLAYADLARVNDLARAMCAADVLEMAALGSTPEQALRESIELSEDSFTLSVEDEPIAVFGVVRQPWGGRFWLLTTEALKKAPREFLTAAKRILPHLLDKYRVLANEAGIDARHKAALGLARHMGFSLGTPHAIGTSGEVFIPFHREAA
jgi:hypothetical protein